MGALKTEEEFNSFVAEVEARTGYERPLAFGIGIGHLDEEGNFLDMWFPVPNYQANYKTAAVFADACGHLSGTKSYRIDDSKLLSHVLDRFAAFENDGKPHENIDAVRDVRAVLIRELLSNRRSGAITFIAEPDNDTGPVSVEDAYLRLHLLSHRHVQPNDINLDNLFGVLPNVVWTSKGPMRPEAAAGKKMAAMMRGEQLKVHSVDKFPAMLDYVVPTGVRIADGARVRLGAYLGVGTTVMHEGFCNFNAGCDGPNMIEGRISAGVWVGANTDLGGGASIMGTLSGGGKEKIRIGANTLIGANAGTGISLGNRCTIEAGLYITAGRPVFYDGTFVKAKELSGRDDLLFRLNSKHGYVEAIDKSNQVRLNEELHKKQ